MVVVPDVSDTPAAGLRVEDVVRAPAVVADFRKVIRQDPRIIQKLHRRVFVDKLTRDQARAAHAT
jgi:MscS family membrane protein